MRQVFTALAAHRALATGMSVREPHPMAKLVAEDMHPLEHVVKVVPPGHVEDDGRPSNLDNSAAAIRIVVRRGDGFNPVTRASRESTLYLHRRLRTSQHYHFHPRRPETAPSEVALRRALLEPGRPIVEGNSRGVPLIARSVAVLPVDHFTRAAEVPCIPGAIN